MKHLDLSFFSYIFDIRKEDLNYYEKEITSYHLHRRYHRTGNRMLFPEHNCCNDRCFYNG